VWTFEQTFAILATWHNPGRRGWTVVVDVGTIAGMDTDFPHLDETVVATARYLEALTELDDDDVRAPSLLPGWTRAHLITHVARNADALANVLHGAQLGEVRAQYPSDAERDADIQAGAGRRAAELREDSVAAAGRWRQAAEQLHASHLDNLCERTPGGKSYPARRVPLSRRTEIEVHHADLDIGYTAADWPADFVEALFKRRHRELATAGLGLTWRATDTGSTWTTGEGPEVTGTAADLVWWLLGRGTGAGLACSEGQLPELGKWA
jgi:maleylpyruvate isomerase